MFHGGGLLSDILVVALVAHAWRPICMHCISLYRFNDANHTYLVIIGTHCPGYIRNTVV